MGKVKIEYKQGDIVWVDYPFMQTPEEGKKRPAVIVSNADCHKSDNEDFILSPVTTNVRATKFSFFLENEKLIRAMPVKDCEVRGNKLFTLSKDKLDGRITEIKPSHIEELLKIVSSALAKE